MSAPTKRNGPSSIDPVVALMGGGLGLAALVSGVAWVAMRVDDAVHSGSATSGRNPLDLLGALVKQEVAWTPTATVAAVVSVLLLAAGGATTAALRHRARRGKQAVDRAAPHMGKGKQITVLREDHVRATARRLGCTDSFGIKVAAAVPSGVGLWLGWEDVAVDIWGPRSGKTTSRAIPAVLDAPGAVLATSNKRDLVDATRDVRGAGGDDVWVFDPQRLVDEDPDWWWNPLTFVVDEVSAVRLAKVFVDATRDPGSRGDAYFDNAARDLLAGVLLAAARAGRPITDVFVWLADSTDNEPQKILEQHGHGLIAAAVGAVLSAPDRQRVGVYDSAKQIVSFLINAEATRWVTPGRPGRREFVPAEFVRSKGTLYSLSKEGVGTAGPIVLALTVAVMAAAEEYAKGLTGGRLATPMVVVLDEAANVCRWSELPDMYSHFGSRGIIVQTFLQSWSQGVQVWGREGMRKLWSAATVRVYGGGVAEPEFLSELSQLIGEFERTTRSETSSRNGSSTSWQATRERVLDVADLGSLPRGRIILFAAGAPAVLAKPIPWMAGPHADAVRASIARHDVTSPRLPADQAPEVVP
ncbi:type IV secretory system conjugative DNA transfer family protein [Cellulomonas sp. Y8]|uniref:type IV secretory system conjugative DNA transfer family protein n=1 Tax=Cellulomonas sp. Y8 TaxID=2591145 RepID=UPI003D713AA4